MQRSELGWGISNAGKPGTGCMWLQLPRRLRQEDHLRPEVQARLGSE